MLGVILAVLIAVTLAEDAVCATSPATTTAYLETCGQPSVKMGSSRSKSKEKPQYIVGGSEALRGSIPWQASLILKESESFWCGGSLYRNKWIITAAHCVINDTDPLSYFIVLGEHTLNQIDGTEEVFSLKDIIIHKDYDESTNDNDIAILKLNREVCFTDYISPICLPSVGEVPKTGKKMLVSGWGTTVDGGDKISNILLQVTVPIVKLKKCKKWLRPYVVTDSMICAGVPKRGGKDTCQGDSGGPLFVKDGDGKYQLIGIVSWGLGCAVKKKPGVYVRVSNYIDWIEENAS